MPGNLAVENLDNLGDPVVHNLKAHLSALALEHGFQVAFCLLGELHTRKQVTEQRAEQRQVQVHQLGHDQVLHGAVEDGLLASLGVNSFERTRCPRDGNHKRTKGVIVVILLRQLLLRQFHDGHHLLREGLRGGKPLREHHDLGD